MRMKAFGAILGAIVVFFIAAMLWYRWDAGTNHGYRRGYWGQFNTVSNALASLPGITIVNSSGNADVTMEEFGFEVVTSEGRQLHVWFSEADPIRRLSGEALTKALLEKLKKLPSNKTSVSNGVVTFLFYADDPRRAVSGQHRYNRSNAS